VSHRAVRNPGTWNGVKWLVDVDVVGFFDNIDHGILLDLLRRQIDNERFIRLIAGMLKAGWRTGPSTPPSAGLRKVVWLRPLRKR
jgi:retron-type reverse transcriptase